MALGKSPDTTQSVKPTQIYWESFVLLLVLSGAIAGLIWWREAAYDNSLSLAAVMLWQSTIWLTWLFLIRPLEMIVERLAQQANAVASMLSFGGLVGLLLLHFAVIFATSNGLSPLSHLPGTKYGVFPYFFIFFALLDAVIMLGLMIRIGRLRVDTSAPRIAAAKPQAIAIRTGKQDVFLKPESIRWIASEDYYSRIHTVETSYLVRQPLKALLDRLPQEQFVRVHRSSIINLRKVAKAGARHVELDDGTTCAMSRTGRQRLQAAI